MECFGSTRLSIDLTWLGDMYTILAIGLLTHKVISEVTMAKEGARHIAVSPQERSQLEEAKKVYETNFGQRTDWGGFLGSVVLLGLAAAGVYGLVRAARRSAQSVDIECCSCGGSFVMAVPAGTARAVQTICPLCNAELVVDLGG